MTQTGLMNWPYPTKYNSAQELDADVLVLGGGMAGPMAAITAAKKGLRVVLVDKGCTNHSGFAGSGFDHWSSCPNPASPLSAEEFTEAKRLGANGWFNGISNYIQARDSYDVLLEMESYGAKVRDTDDVFKGAEFRDEKTKLLFANDYVNRYTLCVWGRTFKPALYKELKRVGVKLYERVMATSLLTEGGKQGARVVGATGVNVRTGEFYTIKAKATILCLGHPAARGWVFSTELQGSGGRHGPSLNAGDGESMAWRAGAEFTMMEKTAIVRRHHATTEGSYITSWHPCSLVDAEGKQIPWVDKDGNVISKVSDRCKFPIGKPALVGMSPSDKVAGAGTGMPSVIPDLQERISKGEYKLPIYCDFPSMPEHERRVIYGFRISQEGTTWLGYHNMTRAGFDPEKHLLQVYEEPVQGGGFGWRRLRGGGVVIDWDLRTNLEGLYATGDQVFNGNGVSNALATGRYAANRATEYVIKAADPVISQSQVEAEKARVYAPIKRKTGIEWKELESGIAKVMQHYCGDTKSDERLKIGLKWLDELSQGEAQAAYARNPHELMRTLEVLCLIDWCQAVMHQCLARKSSNRWLQFKRLDYPADDPPEWRKWITIKQLDGKIEAGELPLDYYGDLVSNYEKHCGL